MGWGLSRESRECGQTVPRQNAQGESLPPPRLGAMCLGCPENAYLLGPYLSASRGAHWQEEGGAGYRPQNPRDRLPSPRCGTCYEETRYDQWNPRQEACERQRAIKALERLGYTVTVER